MPMASNLEHDVKNQRILIERRGFLCGGILWNLLKRNELKNKLQ